MKKYKLLIFIFCAGCFSLSKDIQSLKDHQIESYYIGRHNSTSYKEPVISINLTSTELANKQYESVVKKIIDEIAKSELMVNNQNPDKSDYQSKSIGVIFYLSNSRLTLNFDSNNNYVVLESLGKERVAKSLRPSSIRYIDLTENPKL